MHNRSVENAKNAPDFHPDRLISQPRIDFVHRLRARISGPVATGLRHDGRDLPLLDQIRTFLLEGVSFLAVVNEVFFLLSYHNVNV